MPAATFWPQEWATLRSSRFSLPPHLRSRCSGSCSGGTPVLLHSIFEDLGAYLLGLVRDTRHLQGLIPIQAPQALALSITAVLGGWCRTGVCRAGVIDSGGHECSNGWLQFLNPGGVKWVWGLL